MKNNSNLESLLDKDDIEIIIIDDDENVRENLSDLLGTTFPTIHPYDSPLKVVKELKPDSPCIILTDLRMPDADGFEFAQGVMKKAPDIPIILMTGYGDISVAVNAMKQGVHDFIEKPFDAYHLIETVKRAVEKRYLSLSLKKTINELESQRSIDKIIIGQCPAVVSLKKQILQYAPMEIPVLIRGATGVGKELVARCLHDYSQRKEGSFVALNCAAIPENIAEAELFGYEKGAFTDASQSRVGKLQFAHNGTLFLDEIESLSLPVQAKLLRALSDQKVVPLGSNKEVNINCRIISATKDELRDNENFRQDLYFRLQVSELNIPFLKDRAEDILILFEYFVKQQCENFGTEYSPANAETRQELFNYHWPGNVRELINVATRYVIHGCQNVSLALEAGSSVDKDPVENDSLKSQMERYEETLLRSKLAEYSGKVKDVLEDLGLERRSFNQKLKKYNIKTVEFKN